MKETGKVIKIERGEVTIEMVPPEICTKCCACQAVKMRHITISGPKARGLKIGESVNVEVNTSPILKVYALFYGAPLIVFIATVLILYLLLKSPLISLAGAALAVGITYVLVGRYVKNRQDLYPNVCD